jgi:hypothetical protein
MPPRHRPFANHPCATSDPALIEQAQLFLALAIGYQTRRTYASGVTSYINFIERHRLSLAFPATIPTLCLWIAAIAAPPNGVTVGTCKVYLAAVVNRHTEMGLDNPLTDAPPILNRVLAGIKRSTSHTTLPKLPITTEVLQSMRPHLRLQDRRDSLLWAMMWTATAGLLRISEFAVRSAADTDRTLRVGHLHLVDNAETAHSLGQLTSAAPSVRYLTLHLEASKTDPLRAGVDIVISARPALDALVRYAALCSHEGLLATTPLFHFPDGSPVHRSWLMDQVDRLLLLTGRNPRLYSSHSFRKGGAVSLQLAGVEDSLIRRAGRWKSDAFHLYLRYPSTDALVSANAHLR